MRRVATLLIIGLLLQISSVAQAAPTLQLTSSTVLPSVRYIEPSWPVPNDPNQLFFVQRSMNANTVVYAANYADDGTLDRNEPITAYWRRFNTDGAARALSFVEARFAYGVRARAQDNGQFSVTLRALPDFPLALVPSDDGARLYLPRPEGALELAYGYLQIDDSGIAPRVTDMILVGRSSTTGEILQLTYSVSDGDIGETE